MKLRKTDTSLANADRDYILPYVKRHIDSLVASNSQQTDSFGNGWQMPVELHRYGRRGRGFESHPGPPFFKLWPGSSEAERENVSLPLVAAYFQIFNFHPLANAGRDYIGKKTFTTFERVRPP
ncbi:hypothetical protein JIN77_07275 [Verrucomicrobiaceae bacterium R5-34]|nr:hypothetical protein [Verrucomicrobiaceae bacterium R5-34]